MDSLDFAPWPEQVTWGGAMGSDRYHLSVSYLGWVQFLRGWVVLVVGGVLSSPWHPAFQPKAWIELPFQLGDF